MDDAAPLLPTAFRARHLRRFRRQRKLMKGVIDRAQIVLVALPAAKEIEDLFPAGDRGADGHGERHDARAPGGLSSIVPGASGERAAGRVKTDDSDGRFFRPAQRLQIHQPALHQPAGGGLENRAIDPAAFRSSYWLYGGWYSACNAVPYAPPDESSVTGMDANRPARCLGSFAGQGCPAVRHVLFTQV